MHCVLTIILSLLLVGPTAGSTTEPASIAATSPATTASLRLADAVPIEKIRTASNSFDFTSRVKCGNRVLLFGQLDTFDGADDDPTATEPVIGFKDGGGAMRVLRIADARLHDAEWMFVATGPKGGEIWGVLDAGLDAMQENVVLVHSTDDGQTFAISAIPKPDRRADYDSFSLDETGRGRLTVFMAADPKRHLQQGYYTCTTSDGGATWSAAQRQPDALKKADDATDDDQDDSVPQTQRA